MSIEVIDRPLQPFEPDQQQPNTDADLLTAGIAPAGFVESYSGLHVPVSRELELALACSDGRSPTSESASRIDANPRFDRALPVGEGYARMWGGKYGLAVIMLGAAATTKGTEGITRNGSLPGVLSTIDMATGGRAMGHSDEHSEGNPEHLRQDDSCELGCALCKKVGEATVNLLKPGLIRDVALAEQEQLMGNSDRLRLVLDGIGQVRDVFAQEAPDNRPELFNVPREALRQDVYAGGEAMILAGEHEEGAAIYNFLPDTVSNPTLAVQQGRSYFGIDVVTVGQEIGRPVQSRETFLWEDYVIATMAATVAVRAALSPNGDPRSIPIAMVGTPGNAVDYLHDKFGK